MKNEPPHDGMTNMSRVSVTEKSSGIYRAVANIIAYLLSSEISKNKHSKTLEACLIKYTSHCYIVLRERNDRSLLSNPGLRVKED